MHLPVECWHTYWVPGIVLGLEMELCSRQSICLQGTHILFGKNKKNKQKETWHGLCKAGPGMINISLFNYPYFVKATIPTWGLPILHPLWIVLCQQPPSPPRTWWAGGYLVTVVIPVPPLPSSTSPLPAWGLQPSSWYHWNIFANRRSFCPTKAKKELG